jgi:predicted porin
MQKKLLGVAVAAALAVPTLAVAQSSVQVYGTVHMSASHNRFSGDTAGNPSVNKWGVDQHSSNFGLRSTESLGGGLTAWFQAEFNMYMERNNGVSNGAASARNSGVGLRGAFGNVYVGTWETPWAQTFRMWDVGTIGGYGPNTSIIGRRETTTSGRAWNCANGLPSNAGSAVSATTATTGTAPAGSVFTPGNAGPSITGSICANAADSQPFSATNGNLGYPLWRRYGGAMFYESPVWSGVQFKLAIQPNERKSAFANSAASYVNATTGVNANPSSWSSSLSWTGMGGRARAFVANMRNKDWSSVGNTDSGYILGGGYDFGVVNTGVAIENYKYKLAAGEVKARQWVLSGAIPIGPGKIGASYAKAKNLTGGGIASGLDTSAKMWNLGYEWALSKRTAVGFGVAKIDNGRDVGFTWSSNTDSPNGIQSGTVNPGTDNTHVFVSIRHSF